MDPEETEPDRTSQDQPTAEESKRVPPLNAGTDGLEDVTAVQSDREVEKAAAQSNQTGSEETRPDIPGFEVVRKIAEGGMGAVFLANQLEPVQRTVAIKVIRKELGSQEVIARFEAERQALARMNHPNIATILDAGKTANGDPYFVMEFVDGAPVTEFCDRQRLGIDQRLELFRTICEAVQHAHQKGIIHRDLKPNNILVYMVDGRPTPKVIDFGLAKALDSSKRLTDNSLVTEFGKVLGTLKYMSPEQAELDPLAIDTRSDIFSLGVILFELLTGKTPLDIRTAKQHALFHVLKLIQETDSPRPSLQLTQSGALLLAEVTANRGVTPKRLTQMLTGELDWVVMRTLARDRGQRYQTAAGLASDIDRFLRNEPIEARPFSFGYQARKFASKHRVLVISSVAVGLGMLAAIVGSTYGYVLASTSAENEKAAKLEAIEEGKRATESATRANAILEIVTSSFDRIAPEMGADADMLARDVLELARESMKNSSLDAQGRLQLNDTLRDAFRAIGEPERSIDSARESIESSKELYGRDSREFFQRQSDLLAALTSARQTAEAIELAREMIQNGETQFGAQDSMVLNCRHGLAFAFQKDEQFGEAIKVYEALLPDLKVVEGPEAAETLACMNDLALSYRANNQLNDAEELLQETLEIQERTVGPEDFDAISTLSNLAFVSGELKKGKKALTLMQRVVALRTKTLDVDHPATLDARANLAMVRIGMGQLQTATKEYRGVVADMQRKLGEDHPKTLAQMINLAYCYEQVGDYEQVVELLFPCVAIRDRIMKPDHPETLICLRFLGAALLKNQELDRAAEICKSLLERSQLGQQPPFYVAHAESLLGEVYLKLDRIDEAKDLLERGHAGIQQNIEFLPEMLRIGRLIESSERLVALYEKTGDAERLISARKEMESYTNSTKSWYEKILQGFQDVTGQNESAPK